MATLYEGYSNKEPNEDRKVRTVRTSVLKERFLELYMQTANVQATCRILGMVPRTVYHWRANDKEFETNWLMADRIALQVLEDEATRRAVNGTQKPVYQGGKLAGYVTEYSDTLMIVLLKARAPHKYKERFSGELTGADGKPLSNEFKVVHVHSNIPLAQAEDQIRLEDNNTEEIEFEENDDELLK